MTTLTTPPIGEIIAENIAACMDALGWEFDHLADKADLDWYRLVRHRADAADLTAGEIAAIAEALGTHPADLYKRTGGAA